MKSSTLIFVGVAVPMTIVALLTEGRLVPLAISSVVALVALVTGLVLFLRVPAIPALATTAPLYDRERL